MSVRNGVRIHEQLPAAGGVLFLSASGLMVAMMVLMVSLPSFDEVGLESRSAADRVRAERTGVPGEAATTATESMLVSEGRRQRATRR